MTVDERVDEWALSAGRGGVFCKNLLHVCDGLPRVVGNHPEQAHANGKRSRASPTRTCATSSPAGPTKSDADHHQLPRHVGPLVARPHRSSAGAPGLYVPASVHSPPSRAGAEPRLCSATRLLPRPRLAARRESTPCSDEPIYKLRQALRPRFLLAVVSPRG